MTELQRLAASQPPQRRNSKLDPYLDDLRSLQEQGYSLEQLRTFLKQIGIEVAKQTIYDFLKRRENVKATKTPASPGKNPQISGAAQSDVAVSKGQGNEATEEKNQPLVNALQEIKAAKPTSLLDTIKKGDKK